MSSVLSLFKDLTMKRRSWVVRRSGMVRRRRMYERGPMRRRRARRLSLTMCCGRLRGATWLQLLLRSHGKRIGFCSGHWVIGKYIFDLFIFFDFIHGAHFFLFIVV
jgi:hypothetical protein